MPTYLARGVSARLGTTPLMDTISPEGTVKKNAMGLRQMEKAVELLLDSELLNEVPVPFPDDEGQHRLNWLGNAPFTQVQVHQDFSKQHYPDETDTRMGFSTPKDIKALVLHVNLSDRTYASGLNVKKTSLKIEVFFNGQLSNCRLITTHDARTGIKGPHQVFAGTRVGFYAERPWVILPPGMAPDGGFETKHTSVSAPHRWQDICRALQSEAHERGANDEGEVPPTAQLLGALANMQMPDQVHNMQKPGGRVFGTIDVVITAGEGRKITSGVHHLQAPRPMPDKNYPVKRQRGSIIAGIQTTLSKQGSRDVDPKSPKSDQELLGLNGAGGGHQEPGFHSEKHAPASSHLWVENQTGAPFSSEISQPNSCSQVPDDARQLGASGKQPSPYNSSASHRNVFPSPHAPQVHPSLWSPLSDTTPGPSASRYPYSHSAQGSVALYSRNFHAFHANGHGQYYPPSLPLVEGMNVASNPLRFSILSMPYRSPQEPPQGFGHTQPSFQSEHLLEASGQSPRAAQYFTPTSCSAQTTTSVVSHDVPRLPPISVSSSGGHLGGPVPPVGLYSVPKKPNRSIVSQKRLPSSQPKKSACDIFLRRLVILGHNKKILVEHQWDPPKRLKEGSTTTVSPDGQHERSGNTNTPSELTKHKDMSTTIHEPASTFIRTSDSLSQEKFQADLGRTREALPSIASILSTEASPYTVQNEHLSGSSSFKKRKTVHHSEVKKSQSSLDLKASHCPPLNQDCVIAYAETKDASNKLGVVRQIRGEKVGEFEEDYVIFATRFFVGEG